MLPLMGLATMLGARGRDQAPRRDDGRNPVVFVHGYGGSRGDFLPMAARLRLAGHTRIYRLGFPSRGSTRARAQELARRVAQIRAESDAPRVDLVAHSMGGLIARLAIHEHGLDDAVGTLITLGTPHLGTEMLPRLNLGVLRELRQDSALLTALTRHEWPAQIRGVSFWSAVDLFVVPGEAALHPAFEAVDASPLNHYSYLLDPRVWSAVRRVLAGERVTTVARP